MNNSFNAGKGLGEVLGGLFGNKEPGKAYYDQLGTSYEIQGKKSRSEEAFEEAARARSMNIARDGITADVIARARAGDRQAEAELGAAVLRSAQTPNLTNYTGGAKDFQELGFRDAAVDAGIDELGAMNGNLAGVANGPIKTNTVDSGYIGNAYKEGAPMVATATENAKIEELGARADVSRAKAAAGGFAPKSPSGGGGGGAKRTAPASKAIVSTLEKEMGRKLTAAEVDTIYAGGDFNFQDAPGVAKGAAGKAPPGVDQSAYAKATKKKADALDAIRRGAPKDKVAARLKEQGYPKLAEWVMGAR